MFKALSVVTVRLSIRNTTSIGKEQCGFGVGVDDGTSVVTTPETVVSLEAVVVVRY